MIAFGDFERTGEGSVRCHIHELSGTMKPEANVRRLFLWTQPLCERQWNVYCLTTASLMWLCTLLSHLERRQSRPQKSVIF